METTRTGKSSYSFLMALMRSMPLVPPREMSTMTRSGPVLWMPWRAALASSASPQTTISGSRSMSWRSPSRNMAWSSTRKTRLLVAALLLAAGKWVFSLVMFDFLSFGGQWQFAFDLRTVIGAVFQIQSAAHDAGAVAHDADAHARHLAGGGGFEADAIVFHRQGEQAVGFGE